MGVKETPKVNPKCRQRDCEESADLDRFGYCPSCPKCPAIGRRPNRGRATRSVTVSQNACGKMLRRCNKGLDLKCKWCTFDTRKLRYAGQKNVQFERTWSLIPKLLM